MFQLERRSMGAIIKMFYNRFTFTLTGDKVNEHQWIVEKGKEFSRKKGRKEKGKQFIQIFNSAYSLKQLKCTFKSNYWHTVQAKEPLLKRMLYMLIFIS